MLTTALLTFSLSTALCQASDRGFPPVEPAAPPTVETPTTLASPATAPTGVRHWYDDLSFGGFTRIGAFYTLPLRDEQLIGGNGGFRFVDARLAATYAPQERLAFAVSADLAAPLPSGVDPTSGTRVFSLKDWNVTLKAFKALHVKAGQFRPPYFAEMLAADGKLPFVSRSVVAEGVSPPDAYGPRHGIVLDRQLGVQLSSDWLGDGALLFRYALGAFNGNGPNQLFNDNNAVTPVARAEVGLFEAVTLGVNAFYNARSEGERPNRIGVNQLGYGADVAVTTGGVRALVAFTANRYTYANAVLPADSAWGLVGQVHYVHPGTKLEGAVRYSRLEPSAAQSDDAIHEISGMVGIGLLGGPVRIALQFDHREEESPVAIDNDTVTAFIHATF
jgi:hypothetical protein